jgi:hypothetical protein
MVSSVRNSHHRAGRDNCPHLSLLCIVFVGARNYYAEYLSASQSSAFVIFIFGAVLGLSATALLQLEISRAKDARALLSFLVLLIVVLAIACSWRYNDYTEFRYRGELRWVGPWDNPNTYGLLMGLGVVLAAGAAGLAYKFLDGRRKLPWRRWSMCLLCLVASGILVIGLVKSYSRGAAVATMCAGMYFLSQLLSFTHLVLGRARRSAAALTIVLVSICALAFWELRSVQHVLVRRVLSAANANDFSWRNRVAAGKAALQMVTERPAFGFGWNQPEKYYGNYFMQSRVERTGAFQLNDYQVVATSLGLPAMVCFCMYVWLSLTTRHTESGRRAAENGHRGDCGGTPQAAGEGTRAARGIETGAKGEGRIIVTAEAETGTGAHPPSSELCAASGVSRPTLEDKMQLAWLRATCRAGAIVLLVGFWFDGGLFKITTAGPFWILLELGRED